MFGTHIECASQERLDDEDTILFVFAKANP
jgi:hypothetical protein